jgi:protocatechuate 3,4-dioxygenase beta subunit
MIKPLISTGGNFLRVIFTGLVVLLMTACSGQNLSAAGPQAVSQASTATPQAAPTEPTVSLAASPAIDCQSPATLTPAVTEGPFFKTNSPERAVLAEPGVSGTPLNLTGYVLTGDCKPVAHALLDFWQANSQGEYDNSGYTLRGHQFTDANGHYQLETIIPGPYPGRTEHIHVKVQAPNGPVLTTQLFFPGVADNQSDQIFDPALLIQIQKSGDPMQAAFNFIIRPQ